MQVIRTQSTFVSKYGVNAPTSTRKSQAGRRITIVKQGQEAETISGEWPVTLGLKSWESCDQYYLEKLIKSNVDKLTLGTIMTAEVVSLSPSESVASAKSKLGDYTGAPVLDDGKIVGVVSLKDIESKGGESVSDIMSTDVVTSTADELVTEAASLMLQNKIHRIPIVGDDGAMIGLVTRTDVFQSLEYQRQKAQQK